MLSKKTVLSETFQGFPTLLLPKTIKRFQTQGFRIIENPEVDTYTAVSTIKLGDQLGVSKLQKPFYKMTIIENYTKYTES